MIIRAVSVLILAIWIAGCSIVITAQSTRATAECIRNPSCDKTFVVAHRGKGLGAPENSREAVQKAVEARISVVEVDVRLSKDGYLYLLHDSNLNRTTSVKGKIADKISLELEDAVLKNGETLPMLQDVYDISHGKLIINLDFKVDVIKEVAEWIAKEGSWDDFIFFASNENEMRSAADMKRKYPKMIVMARLWDKITLKKIDKIKEIFDGLPDIIHIDSAMGGVDILKSEKVKIFINDMRATDQRVLSSGANFIQTNNPRRMTKKLMKLKKQ